MRKLVALLLVLAAAPLANATVLQFVLAPNQANVTALGAQANTDVVINVISTDTAASSLSIGCIQLTGATVNASSLTLNELFTTTPYSVGTVQNGTYKNIVLTGVTRGVALNATKPDAGAVLYSFSVRVGAAGTVVAVDDYASAGPESIYGSSKAWTTKLGVNGTPVTVTMSPISFNVVPEPATMALLGLGGLLFARRK